MMDRVRYLIVHVVLLLLFLGSSRAEAQTSQGRSEIWRVEIAHLLHEPPGWSVPDRHETRAVAFSPNAKRLAVTVQHVERNASTQLAFHAHLLILDVASPETDPDQFDLPDNCGVDLKWNSRGDALLVCGALLRLADRATCSAAEPIPLPRFSSLSREFGPYRAWWLDSDYVVRPTGGVLDLHCERTDRWQTEQGWQIIETAPSQNWLLLRSAEGLPVPTTCRYSVVNRQSHQPLPGWPTGKSPCGSAVGIAAGAGMMCQTVEQKLRCLTVNGGRDIAPPKQLLKYRLDQTSDSSARVVAQRWDYDHDPWWTWLLLPLLWFGDDPGGPALPKQAAILDLTTGKTLSSWKPKIQDSRSPHVEDWPFHLSLSSKGDLLAESGDGTLELFRVP